ncbi:hypothetical protein G6F56_013883 [Rhizopus delemar]|nr:hypothetical protein G6F56_013883 [Rhizopus delemar]
MLLLIRFPLVLVFFKALSSVLIFIRFTSIRWLHYYDQLQQPQQLVSLRHPLLVLLVPVMAPMVWFLVFHLVQQLFLLHQLRLPPPSTVSSTLMMWLSLGLLAKFGICWT